MKSLRLPLLSFASFVLTFVLLNTSLRAQDWSQWRGPDRDGKTSNASLPQDWPQDLRREWTVDVGEGHSSPVIDQGRAYLHTRVGENEQVFCLNLEDGTVVWKVEGEPVPYEMNSAATGHGKGPKSTPVATGGRLYTLGITGLLTSWNTENGNPVWRIDTSREFTVSSPLYGTAMSPLVHQGLLIVHVGGNDKGALRAYDAGKGSLTWSWNGDGPGYASPVVVEFDGTSQVVTQTQKKIVGVSLEDGSLLWELPFNTPYVQNCVTPVLSDDSLVFSGLEQGIFAVRPTRTGRTWTVRQDWKVDELSSYMSTPVLFGNRLIGMAHQRKGLFYSIDVRTGEVLWKSPGRQGENAAIIAGGKFILFLSESGRLTVAGNTDDEYRSLREYTVASSPTWAHPALDGQRLLIKDKTTLAAWTWRR